MDVMIKFRVQIARGKKWNVSCRPAVLKAAAVSPLLQDLQDVLPAPARIAAVVTNIVDNALRSGENFIHPLK